jgi:uncharacterized protein YbcI
MTANDACAAPTPAELNVALARAVGRVHRQCLGRGPTKAQAFFRQKLVIVVLSDILTRQESSLLAAGRRDAVLAGRRQLQAAMRPHLTAAVERITGAHVLACLSDTHVDPDVSAMLFMLDRTVSGHICDEQAGAGPELVP